MKILIDMNLSPDWVVWFKSRGIDALHWSTVGRHNAPDQEILEWACKHDCVLFTNDLDFGAILAATRHRRPSVVQVRTQDLFPDSLGPLLVSVLRDNERVIQSGAIVVVDRGRCRIRILPV